MMTIDFSSAAMIKDIDEEGKPIKKIGIIKGNINGKVIKIIPSNDNLESWVILDNLTLSNGAKIIIDDTKYSGLVNFFIDTNLNCAGSNELGYWNGAGICTQKFWNFAKGTEIRQLRSDLKDSALDSGVPDLDPINVNIYSSKYIPSTLTGDNNMMLTAFVRAPYLDVNMSKPGESVYGMIKNRLYYDGVTLSDVDSLYNNWCIAVVGCLNVKSMTCGQPWILLYQKPSGGPEPMSDAKREHTYAVVDYLDY